MRRETHLEATQCRRLAERNGVLYYKFVSPGSPGVPDRLLIPKHRIPFFVEFKDPDGSLSPKQEIRIAEMRENGAHVYVCDNYGQFESILAHETSSPETSIYW